MDAKPLPPGYFPCIIAYGYWCAYGAWWWMPP